MALHLIITVDSALIPFDQLTDVKPMGKQIKSGNEKPFRKFPIRVVLCQSQKWKQE